MAGKNKIMQAVVSFAGTIDPSLGKAMDNVAGHLDKVNWKAVAVGAAVGGIAVATVAVDGGKNAALLAVQIMAVSDAELAQKLDEARTRERDAVLRADEEVRALYQ